MSPVFTKTFVFCAHKLGRTLLRSEPRFRKSQIIIKCSACWLQNKISFVVINNLLMLCMLLYRSEWWIFEQILILFSIHVFTFTSFVILSCRTENFALNWSKSEMITMPRELAMIHALATLVKADQQTYERMVRFLKIWGKIQVHKSNLPFHW